MSTRRRSEVIVDAHVHVWDLRRASYPWLGPALEPINRTVELREVRPALERAGVTRVVLVQSADNEADTAHMFDVARSDPELVAGVVGWVPLASPERVPDQLEHLRRSGPLVGVRNLIHDQPDPGWITGPGPDRGLGVLEAAGVPFDFVTSNPEALALVPGISQRHPALRLVIDHLGKPPVGGTGAQRRAWRQLLSEAAQNPLVFAKISGLYAGSGDPAGWTPDGIRPFVADAIEVLGADRLMFGGDWPISVTAGGYDRVTGAVLDLVRQLSEAERDAVLAGTARSFYRLSESARPDPDPDHDHRATEQ
jgi:L-fuconolactonase